ALVVHGDAADHPFGARFAQLADLGPLQFVDLVADPRQRAGDHGEQGAELGDPVAGAQPGDDGVGQPEVGGEPGADGEPAVAVRDQGADAAAELGDEPARGAFAEPVEVPPDLVRPGRRLPAEGGGRTGLAVGPAGDGGVAEGQGQVEQAVLDAAQVTPDDAADRAHRQRRPGVGDVLDGRPDVDVLAGRLGQHPAQLVDEAQGGVAGLAGALRDPFQVEPLDAELGGDGL